MVGVARIGLRRAPTPIDLAGVLQPGDSLRRHGPIAGAQRGNGSYLRFHGISGRAGVVAVGPEGAAQPCVPVATGKRRGVFAQGDARQDHLSDLVGIRPNRPDAGSQVVAGRVAGRAFELAGIIPAQRECLHRQGGRQPVGIPPLSESAIRLLHRCQPFQAGIDSVQTRVGLITSEGRGAGCRGAGRDLHAEHSLQDRDQQHYH